jgi:hypothetical protein
MSDRDFEVGGKQFKLNKIDVFKQFHIVRRLAPMLGDLIPVAHRMLKKSGAEPQSPESMSDEAVAELVPIFMRGFSGLSDADADTVLLGLCSAVEMFQEQHKTWARVVLQDRLMFSDLELPTLLQIAGRAFQYNLAGFFALLPQVSHGGK